MSASAKLKRKSFFVDERALHRAKRALGLKSDAEVVRLSVQTIAELEEFWNFMSKSRGGLKSGTISKP